MRPEKPQVSAPNQVRLKLNKSICRGSVAERKGFEPSRPFRAYSLSRGAPSTTRPPLRPVPFRAQDRRTQALFQPLRRFSTSADCAAACGNLLRRTEACAVFLETTDRHVFCPFSRKQEYAAAAFSLTRRLCDHLPRQNTPRTWRIETAGIWLKTRAP